MAPTDTLASYSEVDAQLKGSAMKDSMRNPTRMAQAGGVAKGKPTMPKSPGTKSDGLKTAWGNQTAKPSVLSDMSAAKKRVR